VERPQREPAQGHAAQAQAQAGLLLLALLRFLAQVPHGTVMPQEQAADRAEVLLAYNGANIKFHKPFLSVFVLILLTDKRALLISNGNRSGATEDDGGGAGSQKRRQDGSDVTDDGQADMDGEVGGDERSSGDGGGGQYVIRYEKDGEMERVLERQAELIGQYEEEEKAQREWEKQYNENRNANKVSN
jgi:hypothetical protein